MMPVNKILREGAGVRPGDTVEVAMERDEAERTVDAPPHLKKELAKSKKARDKWETLSFTHKRNGDFHSRCQAGRNAGPAARKNHAGSDDEREVDGVRPRSFSTTVAMSFSWNSRMAAIPAAPASKQD